jgi:hypothetical protein
MGYEAKCRLISEGRTANGVARLEQDELLFNGDGVRLTIPLREIGEVHSREDSLFITFGRRRAALEIGRAAEKWAVRIARPPGRLDKLGVKAGMRVALVNLNDPGLAGELTGRGASIENGARASKLDLIFFGARTPADLERLPALAARLEPAGAMWLIRRKGKGAAVTEAASMAAGKQAGLVDVKVVSFSDTHTAEKFVIPVARRARADRSPSALRRRRGSAPWQGRT